MTVLVRPVPKRAYSNGIRPFVRPPANSIRPYTIKNWRPPVPEPLPPAPLLGPKELLGIGALVLAQIWGWLSSRPKTKVPADGAQGGNVTGAMPPPGNTVGGTLTIDRTAGNYSAYDVADCSQFTDHVAGTYRVLTAANVKAVELVQVAGNCGPRSFAWRYTLTNGTVQETTTESVTHGYKSVGFGHAVNWAGDGAIPWQTPTQTLPLPGGYQPPEVEPETEVKPGALPPAPKLPVPLLPPVPAPETQPGIAPVEPGPKRPPTTTPARPPVFRPIRPASPTGIKDGAIIPRPPSQPATTPSDVVFPVPGGQPVGGIGQAPQPTVEGIAQEVGRIERKLEQLMSPQADTAGEKWKLLWDFLDAMWEKSQGGTYTLREPCDPDGDGVYEQRTQDWHGGFTAIGTVMSKIDAVAALLQDHKDLKQPICRERPVLTGDWVTVNFLSDAPSPGGSKRLRKYFRYRDQTARPLLEHVQHWETFEWDAGPVIVVSKNLSWGTPKVWASTAAEGKRVIQHAATIAGVNLNDPKHEWIVTGSNDPRYGQAGRMRVDTRGGDFVRVTSRPSPSGSPMGYSPES